MIEKETLRQRVLYPLLRMTGCLFFLQPRIIIVIIYSTVFGSESTQGGVVAMRLRFFFLFLPLLSIGVNKGVSYIFAPHILPSLTHFKLGN